MATFVTKNFHDLREGDIVKEVGRVQAVVVLSDGRVVKFADREYPISAERTDIVAEVLVRG